MRFEREERQALRTLNGRPPFRQLRKLTRRVQNDACVDVDTSHYSVSWKLIGAEVSVVVSGNQVRIHHAGLEVACHDKRLGRCERAVNRAHLHSIVPCRPDLTPELDNRPVHADQTAGAGPVRLAFGHVHRAHCPLCAQVGRAALAALLDGCEWRAPVPVRRPELAG